MSLNTAIKTDKLLKLLRNKVCIYICHFYFEQYIMTDPSLFTAQIDQTVVADSKKQVFQSYHTDIPLRLLLYINVIFASF